MLLSGFYSIRPPFEIDQADALDWFVDAHTESERKRGLSAEDLRAFKKAVQQKFWHVGCKPDRIAKRGHVLKDYLHRDWEKMAIYRLDESPQGKNLAVRTQLYEEVVDQIFEQYYPAESSPPDDLIHVSCTGYASPSGAQKLASKRSWGHLTTITHAYHMGCYASIPAIRMGLGFLRSGKNRSDIVHTEICSIHTNPSLHETDQLVSQSLFADGFIKYSVVEKSQEPHLRVVAVREEIVADSTHAMTWKLADWGFHMTLKKEIPVLLSRVLRDYLKRLAQEAHLSLETLLQRAIFAIHPGGPKILVYVQELLGLSDWQMSHSFEILKNFGNMSSATLPHIWQAVLADPSVQVNTPVVGLAFGPGLSIAGILLEKQ